MSLTLRAKAKLGRWDDRYLNGHPGTHITPAVRKFITRGYAAGLVCTSTTDGSHAPNSFHYVGRAADMGLRNPTSYRERKRRRAFQRKESRNARRYDELYGPENKWNVRAGRRLTLVEGTPLEQQHDDHVHGAPRY